ncbi:hypothetical protein GH146_03140 [archaeon]|nr:hypothetical protein [archaeon]
MYGSGLKEYPDSGHINDVTVVTIHGVKIFVENVWTSTKNNFERDLIILHGSDAQVKLLIVNPQILAKKNLVRSYEKTKLSERSKGVAISDMIDGSQILNDPQFVDVDFCKIVEKLVSGVRAHITRESVRIERKEHLDKLKEIVLSQMFEVLDSYSNTLEYTFSNFPKTFKLIRPTQSKLFDVSGEHFSELMKNWRTLGGELKNHFQKCKSLYENIGKRLVKKTGLAVHRRFNPSKQPFISESFQKLLWRSMFDETLSQMAFSGLHVRKSDYGDAKEAQVIYWDGTTYAIGGNEEMEMCKVAFEQITEQVDDIGEAQSLLEEKKKLSEKIEHIEDTIRDLLELQSYSGSCRYCP